MRGTEMTGSTSVRFACYLVEPAGLQDALEFGVHAAASASRS